MKRRESERKTENDCIREVLRLQRLRQLCKVVFDGRLWLRATERTVSISSDRGRREKNSAYTAAAFVIAERVPGAMPGSAELMVGQRGRLGLACAANRKRARARGGAASETASSGPTYLRIYLAQPATRTTILSPQKAVMRAVILLCLAVAASASGLVDRTVDYESTAEGAVNASSSSSSSSSSTANWTTESDYYSSSRCARARPLGRIGFRTRASPSLPRFSLCAQ